MKFGRRPAVHNRRTMLGALALAKALDPLGPAPATSYDYVSAVDKVTGGNWGMLGNDSVGDCTCADSGHHLMLRTANVGGTMVTPTTAQVLAMYSAITGYVPGDESTDQGASETDVCNYLQSTGLCGHKSEGSAMINPLSMDHLRWCVQLFGACRLGIVVGQDFIQQFSAHQPWENVTTDPNPGGHDVPIVKYDAQYAYVVTWGGLQPVTWELLANPQFLDECHGEIYSDFLSATGASPAGFDWQQLTADLAALAT